VADRGAKVAGQSVNTTVDRIEDENDAVEAVENSIQTHVLVEIVLQLFVFVLMHGADYEDVEKKAQRGSTRYADVNEQVLNKFGDEFNLIKLGVDCGSCSVVIRHVAAFGD
jgi:hypothetical protein